MLVRVRGAAPAPAARLARIPASSAGRQAASVVGRCPPPPPSLPPFSHPTLGLAFAARWPGARRRAGPPR
jgi:hypothetical protein